MAESAQRHSPTGDVGLTPREHQIASAIALGHSNRRIAEMLSINESTVRHHVTNIFNKTGVGSRL
jgi:DNA-binding CsgD family transcriptional regulator